MHFQAWVLYCWSRERSSCATKCMLINFTLPYFRLYHLCICYICQGVFHDGLLKSHVSFWGYVLSSGMQSRLDKNLKSVTDRGFFTLEGTLPSLYFYKITKIVNRLPYTSTWALILTCINPVEILGTFSRCLRKFQVIHTNCSLREGVFVIGRRESGKLVWSKWWKNMEMLCLFTSWLPRSQIFRLSMKYWTHKLILCCLVPRAWVCAAV